MNRTISLPEELLKKAEELAARESLPVEEFLRPGCQSSSPIWSI